MRHRQLRERKEARYRAALAEPDRSKTVFDITAGPLYGALDVATRAASDQMKVAHAKRKHDAAVRALKSARHAENEAASIVKTSISASVSSSRAVKRTRFAYDAALIEMRKIIVTPHPRGL